MIQITTRGRYALRAMVDLAQHVDREPVPRQEIARRQAISADYVAQLFGQLQDAGLVEGVKGRGGGYRLARAPDQIRARDVIEAVEGPIALVHCVDPEEESSCKRVDHCVTHLLWRRLSRAMREFLDQVTLQDLCDEAEQLDPATPPGQGSDVGAIPSG